MKRKRQDTLSIDEKKKNKKEKRYEIETNKKIEPVLKIKENRGSIRVNTSQNFTLLNSISQGQDNNQHIGRKATMAKIQARGTIAVTASLSTIPTLLNVDCQSARLIIFYDTQTNNGTPTIGSNAISDVFLNNDPNDFLNPNCKNRYKILDDQYFNFGPYYSKTAITQVQFASKLSYKWKVSKNLNLETIFDNSNNIITGALWLMAVGSTTAGNYDLTLNGITRIRYYDE